MERTCCRRCSSVATRCVCSIRRRCMPLGTNAGCERKRIGSMRSLSRERCSAEKRALATCKVEEVATYRELMRLQKQLSDDVVRYTNEIHALLVVLFPAFTQVFADPTRPTALAVLKRYPSAQAIAQTEVESLGTFLHETFTTP